MASSIWQESETLMQEVNVSTKYPPSSQHQVETDYWRLLAARRHPVVDTRTTPSHSGKHR